MKNTKLEITIAILGALHGPSFGLGTDSEVKNLKLYEGEDYERISTKDND